MAEQRLSSRANKARQDLLGVVNARNERTLSGWWRNWIFWGATNRQTITNILAKGPRQIANVHISPERDLSRILICGSGPSLEDLQDVSDFNGVVIATTSSATWLITHGRVPDIIIAADSHYVQRARLQGIDKRSRSQISVVTHPLVHPDVLDVPFYVYFFYIPYIADRKNWETENPQNVTIRAMYPDIDTYFAMSGSTGNAGLILVQALIQHDVIPEYPFVALAGFDFAGRAGEKDHVTWYLFGDNLNAYVPQAPQIAHANWDNMNYRESLMRTMGGLNMVIFDAHPGRGLDAKYRSLRLPFEQVPQPFFTAKDVSHHKGLQRTREHIMNLSDGQRLAFMERYYKMVEEDMEALAKENTND